MVDGRDQVESPAVSKAMSAVTKKRKRFKSASDAQSAAVTTKEKPAVKSGSCQEEEADEEEETPTAPKTKTNAVKKRPAAASNEGKPEAVKKTQKQKANAREAREAREASKLEAREAREAIKKMRYARRSVLERQLHSKNAEMMGLPMAAPTRSYLPDNESSMSASHYQESLDGQLLTSSADAPSIVAQYHSGQTLLRTAEGTEYVGGGVW